MVTQTKVITKKKKFQDVEIPLVRLKIELIGDSIEDIKDKTIKLDLTKQLRGKNVEVVFKTYIEKGKLIAAPVKIILASYFIRRIIRKRISYVEDSFLTPSQESMLKIKPFLITRKRVSRAVRKTLRNKARNWLEDYISQKTDNEIFNDLVSNKLQRPLSLVLKKTYPLSFCEIRYLEITRPLKTEEIPEKTKKVEIEKALDQLKEIEEEKIKKAEEDITKTQLDAAKKEEKTEREIGKEVEETKEVKEKIKKVKEAKKESKKKSRKKTKGEDGEKEEKSE